MSAPRPLPAAVVRRRRVQLIALAVLFLGPLALSALLYYGSGLRPSGHVEHGELVEPARPLPMVRLAMPGGAATAPDFLRHRWSLLMVARGDCDTRCSRALATSAVVRVALDTDLPRVQRVFLAEAGCCVAAWHSGAQADLVVAWLDGADGRRLLEALAVRGAPTPQPGRIYLIDPLGNLLMSYPPGADPRDLLKDLGRLLRLSQIG